MDLSNINIKIEGPYEAAIVAINTTVQMAMQGQTAEQRAMLWDRYLEATKPMHDFGVTIANAIMNPLTAAIQRSLSAAAASANASANANTKKGN